MASINYDDKRFTDLAAEEESAKTETGKTYDGLIAETGGYYDDLIADSKKNAETQANIQNELTDFTIEKIEQQKDKAEKDYTKEQKGAYQDYMKESNAYGSSLQAAGQQGLAGSGWSETIRSGFYNTYQNRYAQARESYQTIVMNYDNNIKEAQLQNSSALATIYAQASKEQLELALQSFTAIKDLKLAKDAAIRDIDNEYNNRWRQVESQINTENSLAEQIRQFNASLAEDKRQFNASLAEQRRQFNTLHSGSSGGGTTLSGGGSSSGSKKTKGSTSKTKKATNFVTKALSGKKHGGSGKKMESSSKKTTSDKKINAMSKSLDAIGRTAATTKIGLGGTASKKLVKAAQKDALAAAYKSGKINKAEFKALRAKYGF